MKKLFKKTSQTLDKLLLSRASASLSVPSSHIYESGRPVKGTNDYGDAPQAQDEATVGGPSSKSSGSHPFPPDATSLSTLDPRSFSSPSQRERARKFKLGYIDGKGRPEAKVSRMISFLAENASEDWPLTLEICRRASTGFAAACDASRTLRHILQYGEPGAQLSATRLLDIMVQIGSNGFITEVSRPQFLGVLEEVLLSSETSPIVRERVLDVIAGLTFIRRGPNTERYRALWKKVKPLDKPEEGTPFNSRTILLNWYANPTQEGVSSEDEDMWRWLLRECEISKGNARLLNHALAFTKPDELKNPVISEWYHKCQLSQDFVAEQVPWATVQVDSSGDNNEELANTKGKQTYHIPKWKRELLLGALLEANGALLEVMRIHDDLDRLGQLEQEAEKRNPLGNDSNRVVRGVSPSIKFKAAHLKNRLPGHQPRGLPQEQPSRSDPVKGSDIPSSTPSLPRPRGLLNTRPPLMLRSPSSLPIHTLESDTYTWSDVDSPPVIQQYPDLRQMAATPNISSLHSPTPVAPLISQSTRASRRPLGFQGNNLDKSSIESTQGVVEPASSPDDKALSELYDEVFASFTLAREDTESLASKPGDEELPITEKADIPSPGTDKFSATPLEGHPKGDRFPGRSLPSLVEGTHFLSPQPSLKSRPNVSVDLPGKIVHFTNTDMVSTKPSTHGPISYLENIPNLTGRIEIIKGPLLAGGFCDIFAGKLTTERGVEPVAMKMLRVFNTEAHVVKAKKKFRGEVNLWRSLRHVHVLPFYGTCELDSFRLFMVSPWAREGNSLEYLRRNPSANRGRLLWQTALALEYLHSGRDAAQVVHGDLKADNVLVSATGDALLCDFGLSRHVEEIISKSGSSSAGRAGGHARFMSPELLLPQRGIRHMSGPTRESDVFAFASLMLQIYTEELPFGDLFEAQAILRIANGDIPSRPCDPLFLERGVDDHIWDLMCHCWQFEPTGRPKMEEVELRIRIRGL